MDADLTRTQACATLALLTASAVAEYNATKTGKMRRPCDPQYLRQLFAALTPEMYSVFLRRGFSGLSSELRVHARSNRAEIQLVAFPYIMRRVFAQRPQLSRTIADLVPNFRTWRRVFDMHYASPPVIESVLALQHQTRALRPLAPDLAAAIAAVTNAPLNR